MAEGWIPRRRAPTPYEFNKYATRLRHVPARNELRHHFETQTMTMTRCHVCGAICTCATDNMFHVCCNCLDGWCGTPEERAALASRGPSPTCKSCLVLVCNQCVAPVRCTRCDCLLCDDLAVCTLLLDHSLCRGCAMALPDLEEDRFAWAPSTTFKMDADEPGVQ